MLSPARHDNTGKLQPGSIGASQPHRQWIGLSLTGDQASVEPLPSPPYAGAPGFIQGIDIEVGFLKRNVDIAEVYSADDMAKNFIKAFNGILMTTDQTIVFEYHGQNLKGIIKSVALLEVPGNPPPVMRNTGIIFAETDVTLLKAPDSPIKIRSSAKKLVGSQCHLFKTEYSMIEHLRTLFLPQTSSLRIWELAAWTANLAIFSVVPLRLGYFLQHLSKSWAFNTSKVRIHYQAVIVPKRFYQAFFCMDPLARVRPSLQGK